MALSNEQQRVYDWLNGQLKLPVFAEAYRGAATLLGQKPPGYISFISHASRDLMNGLASAVMGIRSERVQYQQHVDGLQADWKEEWRLNDEFSPDIQSGHLIPIKVCQKISALIDEHTSGKSRSANAAILFFSTFLDYQDRSKIPANFLSEWTAAKNWFLAHAHLRPAPFRQETEEHLRRHFKCLDGYLFIAASSQYERLKGLDEILDATNKRNG